MILCDICKEWYHFTKSKINNKEGKRVSNALYTSYKMFSESQAPGIQKLTNESA